MAKFSKSILKQAKKAAKEAGNELVSNKKEVKSAHRSARQAMKEVKTQAGEVKWNLSVGDLVSVKKRRDEKEIIGFICKIDSERARKLNDWGQYVEIVCADGKFMAHPKNTKLIQRI